MKTPFEIKQEILKRNYNSKQIKRKLLVLKLAKLFLTEVSVVLITVIPFIIGMSLFNFSGQIALFYLIGHFLFYTFYLKGEYQKEILPAYNEVKITIKALEEIKDEK